MALTFITKERHVIGEEGLWGTYNNAANLTCSPDGYLLIMTKPTIGRLDDMTLAEEKNFWKLSFDKAAAGLHSAKDRGFEESSATMQETKSCHVVVALNDGIAAWQNVGSTHGHLVWTSTPENIGDMQKHLQGDRSLFSGSAASSYIPLRQDTVDLSAPDFVEKIRNVRKTLRDAFEAAHGDISFSLYMQEPSAKDPRVGSRMVIEAWSNEHHSVGSLSQFIRYWNGLWATPLNTQGIGTKYAGFIHD